MSALAIALVLCCAMVCGTVLALRWCDLRAQESGASVDAVKDAVTQAFLASKAAERVGAELESLRAQVALRSM